MVVRLLASDLGGLPHSSRVTPTDWFLMQVFATHLLPSPITSLLQFDYIPVTEQDGGFLRGVCSGSDMSGSGRGGGETRGHGVLQGLCQKTALSDWWRGYLVPCYRSFGRQ